MMSGGWATRPIYWHLCSRSSGRSLIVSSVQAWRLLVPSHTSVSMTSWFVVPFAAKVALEVVRGHLDYVDIDE